MKTKAIEWLKVEYPRGIELVYIDHNDYFQNEKTIAQVLKDGYYDIEEDGSYETESEVIKNYKSENNIVELSDEIEEAMRDWMHDNNTSDPTRDLLRNTPNKLFFIETPDYSE